MVLGFGSTMDAPSPHLVDAPELLYVDMDQLSGAISVDAPDDLPARRSIQAKRFKPWRLSTRCTVEVGRPTMPAIRAGPSLRRRRK